jgi:hypothetical protein
MQVISRNKLVVVFASGAVGELKLKKNIADSDYFKLAEAHIFKPCLATACGEIYWEPQAKVFCCDSIALE